MSLSPLLWHYEAVWRLLAFRTDIDDLVIELLGRLSLERIYADCDRRAYSQLVLTLLVQLNSIFSLQRLYLPKDKQPSARGLSYLVSWEVTMRTVEVVVQLVVDGKESLWEIHATACNALGKFLLSALRVLTLHPKPTGILDFTHRDRVTRLHKLLELVCDNYPDSTDLLLVCREVTRALSDNPYSLAPPTWLRCQLSSLKRKLYPLPDCLSPHYASTIVPPDDSSSGWLSQFLALHDMSQFVIGALIQHAVDEGTLEESLQQAAIRSRNAILQTAKRIRLPDNLAGVQLLPILENAFGVVFSDSKPERPETTGYELYEQPATIESLNTFCKRLIDRQMSHRSSDREVTQNILAITQHLSRLARPSSHKPAEMTPRLYVINCSQTHLVGSFHVRHLLHLSVESDGEDSPEISLPRGTTCPFCHEKVTMLREITLARHVWELLHPLQTDDDTVDTERHSPTQFLLSPVKPGADTYHHRNKSLSSLKREQLQQHAYFAHTWDFSAIQGSSGSAGEKSALLHGEFEQSLSESSRRSSSVPSIGPLPGSPSKEISAPDADRSRLPWRKRLTFPKRNSTQSSSDASSISTCEVEFEKLEEISLQQLRNTSKAPGEDKTNKSIYVSLSQNSTDAVFWTQSSIQVWDVGTSPATVVQSFTTEGSYIVAAVSKTHLAYIFLSRDSTLILQIRNFRNTSDPIVEYRMKNTPWCKNIAISPSGHIVVVGFENATVQFFDTTGMVLPREDRVHCRQYQICNGCPSIETLSFSNDGLNVLASTRGHTGIIQVYRWQYPFEEHQELESCRYHVPMHEPEDNGVTAVLCQPTASGEGAVCITTWTQSGIPVLVHTKDGFRSEIKGQGQGSHGQWKVGTRIQNAAFSPSGRELALLNDNGLVFRVSSPNAAVLDVRKIAPWTKLTARSESFSMSFVSVPNEGDMIILAWVDASKAIGFVKTIRIPISETQFVSQLTAPFLVSPVSKARNSSNYFSETFANVTLLQPPVELPADENHRDNP